MEFIKEKPASATRTGKATPIAPGSRGRACGGGGAETRTGPRGPPPPPALLDGVSVVRGTVGDPIQDELDLTLGEASGGRHGAADRLRAEQFLRQQAASD